MSFIAISVWWSYYQQTKKTICNDFKLSDCKCIGPIPEDLFNGKFLLISATKIPTDILPTIGFGNNWKNYEHRLTNGNGNLIEQNVYEFECALKATKVDQFADFVIEAIESCIPANVSDVGILVLTSCNEISK